MSKPAATREEWLNRFTTKARAEFERAGFPLPTEVRCSIGFPSTGARGKRIGECWSQAASADGHFEIFLHPRMNDASNIADVLTHELVHAAVGIAAGHGRKFRKAATALGLVGKMRSTTAGPAWHKWADPVLKAIGPLPHASLSAGAATTEKKQTTRMIKCECQSCGFTFRATRTWIEGAESLTCPDSSCGGDVQAA